MNKIGKTIADLRKANNMTQSEVADILGVSYQAVSKWERDESLPDIALLPQIADLYHISIDQLLRGSSASINLGPVKLRNSPKINLDF